MHSSSPLSKIFFVSIFIFILSGHTYAQRAIPPHGGVWVHDEANLLSPAAVGIVIDIIAIQSGDNVKSNLI